MPTFHVESAFQLSSREIAVLSGQVVEGTIKSGMLLQIPLNLQTSMSVRIDAIELASSNNGPRICLCFRGNASDREFLLAQNFVGEVLEVTNT